MLLLCLIASSLLPVILGQRYNAQPRASAGAPSSNNLAGTDILSQVSDVNPDGSFYTKWETANGIAYEEQGQLKNPGREDEAESVQGSASWTTNEGERVSIQWLADENGAVFQGDHLPTTPPTPEIPPLIARALAWLAANPSAADEEGQYREEDNGVAAAVRPQLAPRRPQAPRRF